MPVENRVNGAFGRYSDAPIQSSDQEIANFARAPMRLVALGVDDQTFELLRQLVGISDRPTRAVVQGPLAVLFVAIEDLVTGLAGYAEFTAQGRHRLSFQ
jgi:hypothetical protein